MSAKIGFTTTATARPALLDRTYGSFQKCLQISLKDFPLYLNVDPAPSSKGVDDVIRVAESYFGSVTINTPQTPNFAKAVAWCWNAVSEEFVFHLEDDWRMSKVVPLSDILAYCDNDRIVGVILRAYRYRYRRPPLSPAIWRSAFCQQMSFVPDVNPEVQFHTFFRSSAWSAKNLKVVGSKPIVHDTGRAWAKKNKIRPRGKKSSFVRWRI